MEQPTRVVSLFVISQLLDFTMMNFRSDANLEKLSHSAKLHRLSCPRILVERLSLGEKPVIGEHEATIRKSLAEFSEK